MKNKTGILKVWCMIFCLFASLLTGCSDEANENPPKQEKVSVEEIKDDIEHAMSREYAQFLMDDNVDYTVPTKIMDCTFTTFKDFAKEYESFFLSVTESEKLNKVLILWAKAMFMIILKRKNTLVYQITVLFLFL